VSFSGRLEVVEDFIYIKDAITTTLKAGSMVTVKVEDNQFEKATFSIGDVDVEVNVHESENGNLKLTGTIDSGAYKPDEEVSFSGRLEVVEDFIYIKDAITTTLKAGSMVGVKVKDSQFEKATFSIGDVDVEVNVHESENGNLKLTGTIDSGAYKPDEGVSFSGRLEVVEDFIYTKDSITTTLKAGSMVGVDVKDSQFEKATFSIGDVDVEVNVHESENGNLKLKGMIDSGAYKPDEGVSFSGRLEVMEDFIYTKDSITTTLKAGSILGVEVEDNQFKETSFSNVLVQIEVNVPDGENGHLKLKGAIDSGAYGSGEVENFVGRLEVVEDFIYTKDSITTTLKAGSMVGVKVEDSQFKKVTFSNVDVDVEVNVHESENGNLKLTGTIDGGAYKPDEGVSFSGRLEVMEDFIYTKDTITTTLKAGSMVTVKVKDSKFKKATFSNVDIEVKVDVSEGGNGTLKLKGSVSDGKYHDGEMDFWGALLLSSNFNYTSGPLMVVIASGQRVTVAVKDSRLSEVSFSNINVDVKVVTDSGEDLILSGTVGKGHYKDRFIGLRGFMNLLYPFEYEKGKKNKTVDPGPAFIHIKGHGNSKVILETLEGRVNIDIPKDGSEGDNVDENERNDRRDGLSNKGR